MGSTRHEREWWRARAGDLRAVRDLRQAARAWNALSVPLEPRGGDLPPWTKDQILATIALARAWQALITKRHDYESATREHRER
jgi:hypothetical protein